MRDESSLKMAIFGLWVLEMVLVFAVGSSLSRIKELEIKIDKILQSVAIEGLEHPITGEKE